MQEYIKHAESPSSTQEIAYYADQGCQTDPVTSISPLQLIQSVEEIPLSDIPPHFRTGVEQ